MTDPFSFLQSTSLKETAFPETSRYHGIETNTYENDAGDEIVYLERRFLPQPDKFELLQEHIVTENERLDNLTNEYFGDPEQFWKICDANSAIRPNELVETIGNKIRITLPEGIPGNNNG